MPPLLGISLWCLEMIFNIHTLTDEYADAWINGKGNTIVFFVLDAPTNIIIAMGTFSIALILA